MKLLVKHLPANDNGRLLTRLNYKHRKGVPRFGILQIENVENGKVVRTLVLGHDDESAIFMHYDVRLALGAR
ncbi:hypothetical protein MACH17_39770 [Phaeobacter inhibens]|nr:hypothetical protein MACH17_39770 [Phaeobacter inhibens]